MPQERPEGLAVNSDHPFLKRAADPLHESFLRSGAAIAKKARAHERRQRQRHEPRGENRRDDRDRELAEDSPDQAAHERQRQKYRGQGDGHRQDGEGDFPGAVHGRLHRRFAVLHAADGVFQKHDRIVHQEADGQRQRHEGEVVQAVSKDLHDDQRQEQRERQRGGGDQGVRGPAQEDENHQHHQHEGDAQRRLHVDNRIDDGLRAVVNRRDDHRRRHFLAENRQNIADGLSHLHRVRPRLARDGDHHRCRGDVIAAYPELQLDSLVLQSFDGLGNVAEINRQAVSLGDDEIVVIRRVAQLSVGLKQQGLVVAVELAQALVAGSIFDRGVQIIHGDTAHGHLGRIGFDAHRGL